MRKTIIHLLLCLPLLTNGLSAQAATAAKDFAPIDATIEAHLRGQLKTKPPQQTDLTIRRNYWNSQYEAAWRLGYSLEQTGGLSKINLAAQASLKDDPASVALFRYRNWSPNMYGDDISQAISEAETLVNEPLFGKPLLPPALRISLMGKLASINNRLMPPKSALEWLGKGQKLLKEIQQSNADPMWLNFADYELASAQIVWDSRHRGLSRKTLIVARKSLDTANWFSAHRANITDLDLQVWADSIQVESHRQTAFVLRVMGQFHEAKTELLRARNNAIQLGLASKYHNALISNAGTLARDMGEFETALQYLNYVGNRNEQHGFSLTDPRQYMHLHNRIRTLVAMERYPEAMELILRPNTPKDIMNLRPAMIVAQLMAGDKFAALKESEILYRGHSKSINTYFRLKYQALNQLVAIHIDHASKSNMIEYAGTLDRLMDAVAAMSTMNALEQQYVKVLLREYLDKLTSLPESDRTQALLNTAFRAMDQLRDSTVAQSTSDAAARYGNTQSGLDALIREEQDLRYQINADYEKLADLLEKTKSANNTIDKLRSEIEQNETQRNTLLTEIKTKFPEYFALAYPKTPDAKQLAGKLQANELFVSIQPTKERTYVLTLSADGHMRFHASALTDPQIAERVNRLRGSLDISNSLDSGIPVFDNLTAHELYRELLQPVAETWQGKQHLIISASGKLGQIPFAALTQNSQADSFLIKQIPVSHISSALSLIAVRQHVGDRPSKAFAGFGDPVFAANTHPQRATRGVRSLQLPRNRKIDDALASALSNYSQLPPLPETRDEILSIAQTLGADQKSDVYLGSDASRSKVLNTYLGDRRIIAFSTHGLIPGDLPGLTQPALALAKTDKDENPLLLLEDVLGLKLNADWVVLSACNTAAADGEASEAISGLGRGFFYAGARALLVTHWAVESESAKQLVTAIFRNYGEPNGGRAVAVQQAQIAMIQSKNYSHPFFWAPYALIGDGR